jgi:hypothetical protein
MPTAYWAGRISSLMDIMHAEKLNESATSRAGRAFVVLEGYTTGRNARDGLQVFFCVLEKYFGMGLMSRVEV